MKHDVLAGGQAVYHPAVTHVTPHYAHRGAYLWVDLVEPSLPIKTGIERKRRDIGAAANKHLGEMRTDESVRAGDQNLLAVIGHPLIPVVAFSSLSLDSHLKGDGNAVKSEADLMCRCVKFHGAIVR
jgi:hypothetical protein